MTKQQAIELSYRLLPERGNIHNWVDMTLIDDLVMRLYDEGYEIRSVLQGFDHEDQVRKWELK